MQCQHGKMSAPLISIVFFAIFQHYTRKGYIILCKYSFKIIRFFIAVELFFDITTERNKILKNSEQRFAITPLLFQTYFSPSTCCWWLSRYKTQRSVYKGFFESKAEWFSRNYYPAWKITGTHFLFTFKFLDLIQKQP